MFKIKSIIFTVATFAAIGAIAFGFYQFYKRQMRLALSFCYKFSKINIITLSKTKLTLDLTLKIRNQSDIRLNLSDYSFQVWINGKFITVISSVSNTDLLANAVSFLTLRVDFDPSKVFDANDLVTLTLTALTDKKNFIIKIKGKISAKANFIKIKDLPIDMQMSLEDIMKPDEKADEKIECKIV